MLIYDNGKIRKKHQAKEVWLNKFLHTANVWTYICVYNIHRKFKN